MQLYKACVDSDKQLPQNATHGNGGVRDILQLVFSKSEVWKKLATAVLNPTGIDSALLALLCEPPLPPQSQLPSDICNNKFKDALEEIRCMRNDRLDFVLRHFASAVQSTSAEEVFSSVRDPAPLRQWIKDLLPLFKAIIGNKSPSIAAIPEPVTLSDILCARKCCVLDLLGSRHFGLFARLIELYPTDLPYSVDRTHPLYTKITKLCVDAFAKAQPGEECGVLGNCISVAHHFNDFRSENGATHVDCPANQLFPALVEACGDNDAARIKLTSAIVAFFDEDSQATAQCITAFNFEAPVISVGLPSLVRFSPNVTSRQYCLRELAGPIGDAIDDLSFPFTLHYGYGVGWVVTVNAVVFIEALEEAKKEHMKIHDIDFSSVFNGNAETAKRSVVFRCPCLCLSVSLPSLH